MDAAALALSQESQREFEERQRRRKKAEADRLAAEEAKRQQQIYNIPTSKADSSVRKGARFFLTKLKYKNELPPLPFDPKLLSYPLDPMRFVRYTRTSLEGQIKTELLTEPDMGIPIDLVDLERYNVPMLPPPLQEEDAALAEDDVDRLDQLKKLRRTRSGETSAVEVPWLRRTEYIANVILNPDSAAAKADSRPAQRTPAPSLPLDDQIKEIDATFADSYKIPRHPTDPTLTAVDSLPVYPNFAMWKNEWSLCTFTEDPLDPMQGAPGSAQDRQRGASQDRLERTEHSLLVKVPDDDSRFLYCVPTAETMELLRQHEGTAVPAGETEAFECEGELSNIDSEMERAFILNFEADNAVFFSECKTKLRFARGLTRKQRTKDKKDKNGVQTVVRVARRKPTSKDRLDQKDKLRDLKMTDQEIEEMGDV